jgi:hypothetical protein
MIHDGYRFECHDIFDPQLGPMIHEGYGFEFNEIFDKRQAKQDDFDERSSVSSVIN